MQAFSHYMAWDDENKKKQTEVSLQNCPRYSQQALGLFPTVLAPFSCSKKASLQISKSSNVYRLPILQKSKEPSFLCPFEGKTECCKKQYATKT